MKLKDLISGLDKLSRDYFLRRLKGLLTQEEHDLDAALFLAHQTQDDLLPKTKVKRRRGKKGVKNRGDS